MSTFRVRNDAGEEFSVDEERVADAEADGYLPVVSDGSQEHRVEYKHIYKAVADGFKPVLEEAPEPSILAETKAAPNVGLEKLQDDLADGDTFLSQLGRNVPIVGPLGVKAGHAFRAGIGAVVGTDAAAAIPGGGSGRSFSELYEQLQSDDAAAQADVVKERPTAAMLASLAGTAAAPTPGQGVTGLGGAATRIAGNTALVGVDRLLRDDEEAGTAALATGALTAGVESLPYIGRAAKWAGKKAGNAAFGVPEAATERYLTAPDAVNSAKGLQSVTDEFIDATKEVRAGLSRDSGASYQILKDAAPVEPKVLIDPLLAQIKSLDNLGVIGADRKAAIGFFNNLVEDVAGVAQKTPGGIGADKGKSILSVLDGKIDQLIDAKGDKQVLLALKAARQEIDTALKTTSPAYAAHMAELADSTKAAVGIADRFRSDEGALNTLKSIMQGRGEFKLRDLTRFDERFGTNFATDLKDSYTKSAFSRDTTNGSRRTMAGSVVGGTVGSMVGGPAGAAVGGAAGALAGGAVDKYGGQIYKALLDGSMKGGKWAQPLITVYEQRGPAALMAAHVALMGQDPEYKAAFEAAPPTGEAPANFFKVKNRDTSHLSAPEQRGLELWDSWAEANPYATLEQSEAMFKKFTGAP